MLPDAEAPPYLISCPDPTLRAALSRWLDGGALAWPGTIELDVQVVDALDGNPDARECVPQADVTIQAGPPDETVRIRWIRPAAEALVHATKPQATLHFTAEAAADLEPAERGFLLVMLLFVLRRLGWYHIHCAALADPTGRGWLFVGHSQSGKSTTTALLAANGWSVATDDIGFLVNRDTHVAVRGFRSPIALRSGGRTLLGAVGGVDLSRRAKTGFEPEALGGLRILDVEPSVLVFPTVGTVTTMTAMTPRSVMASLIESSLWVMFEAMHAQEHLEVLAQLAGQSRAFRATLGPDLFDRPSMLMELLQ